MAGRDARAPGYESRPTERRYNFCLLLFTFALLTRGYLLHGYHRERLVARRAAVGDPVACLRVVDYPVHRAVLFRLDVRAEYRLRRRCVRGLPDVRDDDGGDRALVVVVETRALPVGQFEEVLTLVLL